MALTRPDIYEHNNPDYAISDSDFVRGGFRTSVDNLSDLYLLSSKSDQLKEYSTNIYVKSESKFYTLIDINNIDNASGWSHIIGFVEVPPQPTKYEIISEAPVIAGIETGTDADGYVIIGATPTNLLSFTYDGGTPFEYNSYIQLNTTIDLELHKRYDVVCLTPTGNIELIEGIHVNVIDLNIPAIPPIPPNYFPYSYVLWDGTATTLLADKVTKLSQLFNDVGFTPNAIPLSEKAEPNGVATLGSDGKIPASQIPSSDNPTRLVQMLPPVMGSSPRRVIIPVVDSSLAQVDIIFYVNNIEFIKSTQQEVEIPDASEDNYRKDLIVGTASGLIIRVEGQESIEGIIDPIQPLDTVYLTHAVVFGDTVLEQPELPDFDFQYLKRPTHSFYIHTVGNDLPLNYLSELMPNIGVGEYSGSGAISGVNKWVGQVPYTTMIFSIENQSNDNIPLAHNGTGDYKFFFPNNLDYVLKPKEVVSFRISGASRAVFIATSMATGTEYVAGAIETAGFAQRTGTEIAFDKWATYNSYDSPSDGDFSYVLTNAVVGMIQVAYHEGSLVPTFSQGGIAVMVTGEYQPDIVNKIAFELITANRILINIKPL